MTIALISGITGQDGSFLAEHLLSLGYGVHGMVRRVANEHDSHRYWRIRHILDRITLHPCTIENYASVFSVVNKVKPDELYHLAAQSFVAESFKDPFSTFNININGTLNVLESIKELCPKCKFYFAGSSEMFGKVVEVPQNENTKFYPRSPYGISKVAGYNLTRNYRESYNIFGCCGILYNHESERRGEEFVTRKVTMAVSRIHYGLQKKLKIGNLNTRRDWGYAGDYVVAMHKMLQQELPDDYVVSTGESHTLEEFIRECFEQAGVLNWQDYVECDPAFCRPADVCDLLGDSTKARKTLAWEPKINFDILVSRMLDNDWKLAETEYNLAVKK